MRLSKFNNKITNIVAALLITLCIGEVYAFSVFNKPIFELALASHLDWSMLNVSSIFSIAIAFLGIGALSGGRLLNHLSPRQVIFLSASFFGGGLILSALGLYLHNLIPIYLGYGVIGGFGVGLGYVTPVAVLVRWFTKRRGMATGLAIMGFGGGAILNAPLSVYLMKSFNNISLTYGINYISWTFLTLGIAYFLIMSLASLGLSYPENMVETHHHSLVSQDSLLIGALKTRNFYLIWVMMCLNISTGIALLSQASLMIQEIFKDAITPMKAAWYVSALGFANMLGRILWASSSDLIGRKTTYSIFFITGIIFYSLIPYFGSLGNLDWFILSSIIVISIYGGGFATLPAYLTDIFGIRYLSSIHGSILLAWSTAGVIGPMLLNYLRSSQIALGIPKAQVYGSIMHLMSGVLIVGLVCNLLIKVKSNKATHKSIHLSRA